MIMQAPTYDSRQGLASPYRPYVARPRYPLSVSELHAFIIAVCQHCRFILVFEGCLNLNDSDTSNNDDDNEPRSNNDRAGASNEITVAGL